METLTDRIALVTGGSRGLGRQIALTLAEQGAGVILTYRSGKAEGEAVAAEIATMGRKAVALPLDTGVTASFTGFRDAVAQALRTTWQRDRFDSLINNAGNISHALITETTEENFDALFNVQFKGVYFLTQKLLPLLADGGRIVNTSTGLTRFATPRYSAYASMKGAVEVFTRYLAKELGPRGITANVVAPGPIETDLTKESLGRPEVRDMIVKSTALGRTGVPEDIAGVVAFLVSDAGRWVNAQRIEASGGIFL